MATRTTPKGGPPRKAAARKTTATRKAAAPRRALPEDRPNPIEDGEPEDMLQEDVDNLDIEEAMEVMNGPNPEDFPDLEAFGEVTDGDDVPDVRPRPYKILGYPVVIEDGEGVVDLDTPREFIFRFRRNEPMGSMMNMLGAFQMGVDGEMDINAICRFLTSAISTQDRQRWMRTLDDDKWWFKAELLAEIGIDLAEKYLGRPLGSRSVRRAGARRTRTTSGARSTGNVRRISGS